MSFCSLGAVTVAAQSSSNSYKVDEVFFGSGGVLQACSGSYCAKQSAGETAVGLTKSANWQAHAGFNTTDTPMLELAVNGNIDLGTLEPDNTGVGTANIQVRTYLASGYSMMIVGEPPRNASHTLKTTTAPEPSQKGTEQFGINLRQNTELNIGADPVQIPDDTFSFGLPVGNYGTVDQYMYQNGDTVAYSSSSTGQTNYTLSMIANISNATEAGRYSGSFSVVVTSTF